MGSRAGLLMYINPQKSKQRKLLTNSRHIILSYYVKKITSTALKLLLLFGQIFLLVIWFFSIEIRVKRIWSQISKERQRKKKDY